MSKKVLLISVDGMRPDALNNIPEVVELKKRAAYNLNTKTVYPSVTLPCHMSLFHSVTPQRHGTTTNVYAPQVRPVEGIGEQLKKYNLKCAFFYNWEELRDLTRPGSLVYSYYCSGRFIGREAMNDNTAAAAREYLKNNDVDFTFLYFGYPDWAGHKYGWMSQEYMDAVANSWKNIDTVISVLSDDYTVIITADHGGHDKTHGTDMPEDMTIPLFILGKDFSPQASLDGANIIDVAPTVTKLLGVEPCEDWDGKALF